MALSTVASGKNWELLPGIIVHRESVFSNSDISARCFTSISRARPPENHKYQSPARSQIFAMEITWFFEKAAEMEHRSRSKRQLA